MKSAWRAEVIVTSMYVAFTLVGFLLGVIIVGWRDHEDEVRHLKNRIEMMREESSIKPRTPYFPNDVKGYDL